MTAALPPEAPRCSCGRPMRARTVDAPLPLLPTFWWCSHCDTGGGRPTPMTAPKTEEKPR